jgi:N-acetylglucosaminyldiphosphoundecaprenol N-acetyl-beta-D-mannosaminyltransferase
MAVTNTERQGRERIVIMGVPIDVLGEDEAVSTVVTAARQGRGGTIVTPNVDHLRMLGRDSALKSAYERADLVLADGVPLVWASRLQGEPLPGRVAGSDLLWSLSAAAAGAGLPVFLVGGRPGAAEAAKTRLKAVSPHLAVVGIAVPEPGFEADDQAVAELIGHIRMAGPAIVFLALGTPKQEVLAMRLADALPEVWWVGVGAAFDMAAGHVRRAPLWVQRAGLEWAFRLCQEPRRLFRRYVAGDIPFSARLFVRSARQRLAGMTIRLGGDGGRRSA